MIEWLISAFINLVIWLVNFILSPIDKLIFNVLGSIFPDITGFFQSIAELFNIMLGSIGWVISSVGLRSDTLAIIVSYYTFKLTAPLLFTGIKSAIKWYRTMKL